jgi:rSAM/selenodomain-associated transferase 2
VGRLSVVIPTLNEERRIAATVERVLAEPGVAELIVADGGSSDATAEIVARYPQARLLRAPARRPQLLNAAAAQATRDTLLFLHADSIPPAGFPTIIETALVRSGALGGAFALRFLEEDHDPSLRLLARINNQRYALLPDLMGDMGIFVRRACFERLGGFPDVAIMEDVGFSRRLQRAGKTVIVEPPIRTSGRRFQQGGTWATLARIVVLFGLFKLGADDRWLARFYRNVR